MMKGTYIVTGATGGIGQAIVKGILKHSDTTVILACRNTNLAEKLFNCEEYRGRTEIMFLDLSDLNSISIFARKIITIGTKLSGIFNNAGVMPGEMMLTADGYEYATQVNFIGTGLLTELLLPMIEHEGGIVFTTSMTRRIARLRNDWDSLSKYSHQRFVTYGRSKLMLTHYAKDLSDRLAGKVRVNCSDPWIVNSKILKMDNTFIDALSSRFAPVLFRTPDEGATPALKAMESRLSGHIFTLHGDKPISKVYAKAPLHHLPQEIIKSIVKKLEDA